MLLFALAEGAAALADAGAETDSGVLEDGNGSKHDAGEEGNEKCEEENAPINADFTNARKSRGGDGRKNAQRGVGEAQPDRTAKESEKDTFEQQIGDIGAGDQKDHTDGAHEDPKDAADVTDDVALERTDVGADARVFEELEAEAGRRGKRAHDDRKHASNVHIHLLDSDSWLEPGETLITEVAEMSFVAVKLKWSDYGGIFPIQEMKSLRQGTDDLTALAIHDDVAAND